MTKILKIAAAFGCMLATLTPAVAQKIDGQPITAGQGAPAISTPPAVDNGIANGVVKPAGSPSVSNGVSNGVVKLPGAPSVGDGMANGVVKSTTVNQ